MIARLRTVLGQLSPKCRAAVILQYRHGLTYEEIGERLNVSPHMVKKYLAQALTHCRRRMARTHAKIIFWNALDAWSLATHAAVDASLVGSTSDGRVRIA